MKVKFGEGGRLKQQTLATPEESERALGYFSSDAIIWRFSQLLHFEARILESVRPPTWQAVLFVERSYRGAKLWDVKRV